MAAGQGEGRSVPMEVLVLGVGRTGTQSIADALAMLGYNGVYHMREVFTKEGHDQHWLSAMEAKYEGKGKPYGRAEFDAFIGDYMAVTDFPAAMFWEELIAAYPSAKVILSIRDEDSWYKSVESTIWHSWLVIKAEGKKLQTPRDMMLEKLQVHVWDGDFPKNGRKAFREHNENIRRAMSERKEDFLEYNIKDGWEPLCRFLGKEIPTQDIPHTDMWVAYKESVKKEGVNGVAVLEEILEGLQDQKPT
ncbi:hypothetical protein VTN77DRAFT_4158 [Rasamsonia byssochlamydoides]|uniref:uncharacterized protein n=1 Tax=Rasamsonia byssochlamydoides TaxID=89139 RepID=UPI00374425DD